MAAAPPAAGLAKEAVAVVAVEAVVAVVLVAAASLLFVLTPVFPPAEGPDPVAAAAAAD